MKRCPACKRNYTDDTLRFCLEDGTPLTQAPTDEPTITTTPAEPPPTLVYGAAAPTNPTGSAAAPAPPAPPAWQPTPVLKPKRKVWPWVLGALILLCILGVGFIVLLIGLASWSSSDNSTNSNAANTKRVVNSNPVNANNSSASPNPTPTNIGITKVYMAKDNGSGEPGDEAETFSPSDHTVHCMIELDQAAEGTVIRFDWIGVDAGVFQNRSIKKLDYTTRALENKVNAHLTLPSDWPEGEYKVDVYLNDQLSRSITYKVE